MISPYLEISFRHGRPFAAYLHCSTSRPATASLSLGQGLVLDQDADGAVIGLEITAPSLVSAALIQQMLADRGVVIAAVDLAPLAA
jgi:uncharacterized protein YuzE